MKRGLQLDRVVLLGRTLEEYRRSFALDLDALRGTSVLDLAAGVSSFTAEARERGIESTAVDPIYDRSAETIRAQSGRDLAQVVRDIAGLATYRWDFYKTAAGMRTYRERALDRFSRDYEARGGRYVSAAAPRLPFKTDAFGMALVSYFLFVYEARFDWDFHRDAIEEIMRVTRGEARLYPLVTFDGVPSAYLARLGGEPRLAHLDFRIVPTDFEFLAGSNAYLRIRHRSLTP